MLCSDSNVLTKLGAVKGIICSFGLDSVLFKVDFECNDTQLMASYMKLFTESLKTSQDTSVCFSTALLLGQLHMASENSTNVPGNVPQNYNYLPNVSHLQTVFNTLLKASTSGPYGEISNNLVKSLLLALNSLQKSRLPPVNWTLVLNPLLRIGFDEDVKLVCIKFAVKFADSASSLALLISSWLQASVFDNFTDKNKIQIFSSVTQILPCLTNNKQRYLLEELTIRSVKQAKDASEMVKCVITAWNSVLLMASPIQSTVAYVMVGLKSFLESFGSIQQVLTSYIMC